MGPVDAVLCRCLRPKPKSAFLQTVSQYNKVYRLLSFDPYLCVNWAPRSQLHLLQRILEGETLILDVIMRMKKQYTLLCLSFLTGLTLQAQAPLLTASDAVREALERNHDILVSKVDVEIARENNTKANAGMLPTVNLVANENLTVSAFGQQLANGSEFSALGAPFNAASAGVQLNWTLFDGHRMQIARKRLAQLELLGEQQLQNSVEQTTAAVLQSYYDIVRGGLQERATGEIIRLNEERLRIAEARLAAGFAAQTDALQAKIDLNQRKADLLVQQNATESAKRNLNRLLVRPVETAFTVSENIEIAYNPDRSSLYSKAYASNGALVLAMQNAALAALNVEDASKLNKPRITGTSQLNAIRSDNGAGFLKNNTQAGLSVGAGLIMPLYTGGNLKRQQAVARLSATQANLRIEQQKMLIAAEIDNQLSFYQTQRQVLALEEENVRIARENLAISTERFRVGTTNGLEPQTAQNALEQALNRRDLVLYNLKIAELRLKLIAGEL